jgi:hypothetical protein
MKIHLQNVHGFDVHYVENYILNNGWQHPLYGTYVDFEYACCLGK